MLISVPVHCCGPPTAHAMQYVRALGSHLGSEYIGVFDASQVKQSEEDSINHFNSLCSDCRALNKPIIVVEMTEVAGWSVPQVHLVFCFFFVWFFFPHHPPRACTRFPRIQQQGDKGMDNPALVRMFRSRLLSTPHTRQVVVLLSSHLCLPLSGRG
jgi:hypothetical protein